MTTDIRLDRSICRDLAYLLRIRRDETMENITYSVAAGFNPAKEKIARAELLDKIAKALDELDAGKTPSITITKSRL